MKLKHIKRVVEFLESPAFRGSLRPVKDVDDLDLNFYEQDGLQMFEVKIGGVTFIGEISIGVDGNVSTIYLDHAVLI